MHRKRPFLMVLIVLLVFSCVSCGQASPSKGEKFVKGKGPAGLDVNTEYAVVVKGPAQFTCTFAVVGPKAFVLYRREFGQWTPKASCNNGAGEKASGSLAADGGEPFWMITGWYTKNRAWQQCNFKGWARDGDGEALECNTFDGGSMKFTCPKGQCDKP